MSIIFRLKLFACFPSCVRPDYPIQKRNVYKGLNVSSDGGGYWVHLFQELLLSQSKLWIFMGFLDTPVNFEIQLCFTMQKNPKNLLPLLFSQIKIGWTYWTPPPIKDKDKKHPIRSKDINSLISIKMFILNLIFNLYNFNKKNLSTHSLTFT